MLLKYDEIKSQDKTIINYDQNKMVIEIDDKKMINNSSNNSKIEEVNNDVLWFDFDDINSENIINNVLDNLTLESERIFSFNQF